MTSERRRNGISLMTRPKWFKWHWFAGASCALTFVVLFAWRVGVFQPKQDISLLDSQPAVRAGDTWMNVFQGGRKIGFTHRAREKTSHGYRFTDSALMRINTMGVIQDVSFRTDGNLKTDGAMEDFRFDLRSSLFRFSAWGTANGKEITVYTGMPGREKKTKILLKEAPRLSTGLLETVLAEGIKEGQSRTFHIFDPSSMSEMPVIVSASGYETISVSGKQMKARKISVAVMGAKQTAWLDGGGEVLREEGFLGITLERTTRQDAERGIALSASSDLVEMVSLPSDRPIADPLGLLELRVRLEGADLSHLALRGGRQAYDDGILTIRREVMSSERHQESKYGEKQNFLEPSPFIQSHSPAIREKVREIVSPGDSPEEKAKKLVEWVYRHVEKRPVISVPDAEQTLKNMVGDCNEHAALLAALARAAGIPAQVEAGLVYQKGRFYYHAWNVLYVGSWITADSALGQMPADVTHIRLVQGALERQTDLLPVIGNLRLAVVGSS